LFKFNCQFYRKILNGPGFTFLWLTCAIANENLTIQQKNSGRVLSPPPPTH
jgi:hypothetical protein